MLIWLWRRRQAARQAQADADAMVRQYGDDAYSVASRCELWALLGEGMPYRDRTPSQWRRVALLIEKRDKASR
jgi:hypothetical protein